MALFSEVLNYMESHDWILFRIEKPYRIFYKDGSPASGLPILVEVNDGHVDDDDFTRIRGIVMAEQERDE